MRHLNRQLFAVLVLILGTFTTAFAQITPSQDSYTNTANSTVNFGTATTLGVVSAATSIQTTYIQFDLSSVPAGFTSANVAKATLKLYVNSVATAGSFNVDYVNGTWSEKTITAGVSPALGGSIASSVPLTSANVHDFVLIDVTSAVSEWLSGAQANDGIALVANSPLSATFDSKENTTQSHPAELDIVFTSGGTISGVNTASGSGLTGGGTTGSLNLSLQKTCSSNQVLQWNGSAWVCASVGTGTVTSVGLAAPASDFLVSSSPVTGTGTLAFNWNVPPASANNGNAIVKRDANGNFAGSTVNAINVDATNVNASFFSGNGTGVTNVNAAQLGGLGASSFATVGGPNTFLSTQSFLGYNLFMYTGDPGCGSGYAGIGFGQLSGCTNYALAGTIKDTYLNRPSGGSLFFSENNAVEMTVDPGGYVRIFGPAYTGGALAVGNPSGYYPSGMLTVTPQTSTLAATGIFIGGSAGDGSNGSDGSWFYGGDTYWSIGTGGRGIWAFGGNGGQNPTGTGGVGGWFQGGEGGQYAGDGIDATVGSFGANGWAGNFSGNVDITGTLFAGAKDFRVDHPLDPANKYLQHTSVESSEMMNVYSGNVTTDAQGDATVMLPDWFEALNTDFRYQLTVIGQFAQAIVAREIENREFQVKTSVPNVKVSWLVTGVRQDAYAKAHPLVVEEEKEPRLKGFYVHPELYGAPEEKQIEWARNPAAMKRMKEERVKSAERAKAGDRSKIVQPGKMAASKP